VLELRGVVSGYRGGNVIHGIDLSVEEGSITCIVGPNGAGKSTVLRTISGLLRPNAGTISYRGAVISARSCGDIIAAGIVQVPQQHALFPMMTVKENILMGGYLLRRKKKLITERFDAVADLISLVKERPSERAGNLSGGERRMVEIGRSLMLEPSLIMMDEPSLGLDPKAAKQVTDLILVANKHGRTMLLVEQNVRLGFGLSTHAVVMESGRVKSEGSPQALLNDPQMARLYLGGTVGSSPSAGS
jgi:branched-chain amino acid transport system ATP-binding protein